MTAPPLWFSVPEAFTALDLGEAPESRVDRTVARTSSLTGEQRLHLVLAQELMIGRMRAGRIVYAANSLVRMDGDVPRLSFAQLTVAVHPVAIGNGDALDSIAGRLDVPGLCREVGFLQLGAGRALAVIEDRTVTTDATVLGTAGRRKHTVRQVQVMLPFPDGAHLAVLALSTECLQDWSVYVRVMGGIVRTASFRDPADRAGPANLIAAALSGGPGRPG